MCVDSLDIFKQINQQSQNVTSSAIDDLLNTDLRAVQNVNEKTPSKPKTSASFIRDPNEKSSVAKCLFDSPKPTTSTSQNTSPPKPKSFTRSPISFKLPDIYQRLHGCVPDIAHTAEADTRHLLLCAIASKHEFVNLTDSMATHFINFVQPKK